mmetsp:Transcript_2292/g.6670  ORF Transcript_2292/g.6670 Transcript_2292/m.6670 type:complete len:207 (+) Transcript_2292:367-987(+)
MSASSASCARGCLVPCGSPGWHPDPRALSDCRSQRASCAGNRRTQRRAWHEAARGGARCAPRTPTTRPEGPEPLPPPLVFQSLSARAWRQRSRAAGAGGQCTPPSDARAGVRCEASRRRHCRHGLGPRRLLPVPVGAHPRPLAAGVAVARRAGLAQSAPAGAAATAPNACCQALRRQTPGARCPQSGRAAGRAPPRRVHAPGLRSR